MAKNDEEKEIQIRPEIEELGKRWQKNPKSLVFVPLADAYRKSRMIEEAIMVCEGGLEHHPNNAGAHVVLAKCYLDSDNPVMARNSFEKANELDPTNIVALKGLADIYKQREMYELAAEKYEQVIELDPFDSEAEKTLENIKNRLNTQEEPPPLHGGQNSGSITVDLDMDDPEPVAETSDTETFQTDTLADLYEQQGFHEKALAVYENMADEKGMTPGLQAKIDDLRQKLGMESSTSDHQGNDDENDRDVSDLDTLSDTDEAYDFEEIALDDSQANMLDELPEFEDDFDETELDDAALEDLGDLELSADDIDDFDDIAIDDDLENADLDTDFPMDENLDLSDDVDLETIEDDSFDDISVDDDLPATDAIDFDGIGMEDESFDEVDIDDDELPATDAIDFDGIGMEEESFDEVDIDDDELPATDAIDFDGIGMEEESFDDLSAAEPTDEPETSNYDFNDIFVDPNVEDDDSEPEDEPEIEEDSFDFDDMGLPAVEAEEDSSDGDDELAFDDISEAAAAEVDLSDYPLPETETEDVETAKAASPPPTAPAEPRSAPTEVLGRTLVQQLPLWVPQKKLKNISAMQLLDALLESYTDDIDLDSWLGGASELLAEVEFPAAHAEPAPQPEPPATDEPEPVTESLPDVMESDPAPAQDADEMLSFMEEEPAPAAEPEPTPADSDTDMFDLDFGAEAEPATPEPEPEPPSEGSEFEEDTIFDFAPEIKPGEGASAEPVEAENPGDAGDDLDLDFDTIESEPEAPAEEPAEPEPTPEPTSEAPEKKKKKEKDDQSSVYSDHGSFQDWLNGLQKK